MEQQCPVVVLPNRLILICLLYTAMHLTRAGTTYSDLGPSLSIDNEEYVEIYTDQSDGGNFSKEVSSS